jgi:hypothetical protein
VLVRKLAVVELMAAEDPAKEVRVFDNGKQILTLTLNYPEAWGAKKIREIHLQNVAGPRELLQSISHLRKMFRWVTHPDPKQSREEQDRFKDIFWGKFRQMRALMQELGV